MWLLDCGKDEVFASLPFLQKTTKICLEKVDDKLLEVKKYMARSCRPGGQTILQINSKGDWEYAPSSKR